MMANANCPQILPYAQEIRGKNHSRRWSSRGQKLYKNLFASGLGPRPRWGRLERAQLVGRGTRSPPQEPRPASAFQASAHHLENSLSGAAELSFH